MLMGQKKHQVVITEFLTKYFFLNRIIARAGHALQAIDVKQALPIKDIDA